MQPREQLAPPDRPRVTSRPTNRSTVQRATRPSRCRKPDVFREIVCVIIHYSHFALVVLLMCCVLFLYTVFYSIFFPLEKYNGAPAAKNLDLYLCSGLKSDNILSIYIWVPFRFTQRLRSDCRISNWIFRPDCPHTLASVQIGCDSQSRPT